MTIATYPLLDPIPTRAKVFGWLLVLAGCFFGYVFMAMPGAFFPGVTVESFAERFGLYSTGVRVRVSGRTGDCAGPEQCRTACADAGHADLH